LLTSTTTEVLRITNDPAAAIAATPPDGRSLLQLARNLRTLGREEAAVDAARQALALDPGMIEALDLLGDLALQEDELEEAALLVKQALEVDPLHDRTYLLQGKILLKQGHADEAERAWQEGLKQIPDSTELAYQLVEFFLSKSRLLDAEEIAGKLQNFAPTDDGNQGRLQSLFGRIYETKGMLMEARRSYQLAATLLPANLWSLFKVAEMEARMGNFDEAERIYKQLLAERFNPQQVQQRIATVQQARDRSKQQVFIDTLKQGEEKPEKKSP
jgi:tetratricopeptide (TPR) repeat protein